MAYYYYKVRVGIFEASVRAESWQKAVEKLMASEAFDDIYDGSGIKCIEVRRIRSAKED